MAVLFVDDDEERWLSFSQRLPNFDLEWAMTAQGAIAQLKEREFKLVFLDHDLAMVQSECSMV